MLARRLSNAEHAVALGASIIACPDVHCFWLVQAIVVPGILTSICLMDTTALPRCCLSQVAHSYYNGSHVLSTFSKRLV